MSELGARDLNPNLFGFRRPTGTRLFADTAGDIEAELPATLKVTAEPLGVTFN